MRKAGFGLIAFFAISVALYAHSYLFISHGFLSEKGDLLSSALWNGAFYMHVVGGGTALLIGWLQFWKGFRTRRMPLHRILGKIYVIAILMVGAPGGLYLAYYAMGGFANQLGFGSLAVVWILFTIQAYRMIRVGNVEAHLDWMIRSYAITFAAPALRIWLPFFIAVLGAPFQEAYVAVAWFCWVPNLFLAEWIINRRLVQA